MGKSRYNPAYQYDKGFNADVNAAAIFNDITDEQKEEVEARNNALILDTQKRLFGLSDEED